MKTAHHHTHKPAATRKAPATPVPVRPARVPKIHPAEAAGMAVHQTVENGVVDAKDAVLTAGGYVIGFFKGLVKGH